MPSTKSPIFSPRPTCASGSRTSQANLTLRRRRVTHVTAG
jgi:hypothetical protein